MEANKSRIPNAPEWIVREEEGMGMKNAAKGKNNGNKTCTTNSVTQMGNGMNLNGMESTNLVTQAHTQQNEIAMS